MQPQLGDENPPANSLKHHLPSSAILLLNVSDCFSLHVVDGGLVLLRGVFCRAEPRICASITREHQNPIAFGTQILFVSTGIPPFPNVLHERGVTLTVGCYFCCFSVFSLFVCAHASESTLLHLFLFYKTMSCLIGGSVHPAASEHGVGAPGNWFKGKMK